MVEVLFAALMGAPPTAHWRALSAIPEATFQAALVTWTIEGTPATMWQIALASTAARAARIAAGVQLRTEVVQANAQHALYIQSQQAQRLATAATLAAQQGPVAKVKLTETIGQFGLEAELTVDDDSLEKGQVIYTAIFGGLPTEEEDITAEQLTGFQALLRVNRFYIDFAIFGPFGTRQVRRQKIAGMC